MEPQIFKQNQLGNQSLDFGLRPIRIWWEEEEDRSIACSVQQDATTILPCSWTKYNDEEEEEGGHIPYWETKARIRAVGDGGVGQTKSLVWTKLVYFGHYLLKWKIVAGSAIRTLYKKKKKKVGYPIFPSIINKFQ